MFESEWIIVSITHCIKGISTESLTASTVQTLIEILNKAVNSIVVVSYSLSLSNWEYNSAYKFESKCTDNLRHTRQYILEYKFESNCESNLESNCELNCESNFQYN